MSTEVTPEQGPNGGASPMPEGEPEPNGIRLRIEDPDVIFELLKKGFSVEVGRFFLPNPVTEVGVTLEAIGESNFDLKVKVSIDPLAIRSKLVKSIMQEIQMSNNDNIEGIEQIGNGFFVTTASGIEFVVDEVMESAIDINTGLMVSRKDFKPVRVFDPPSLERETYDNVMAAFTEVFPAVAEAIYKSYGEELPNKELVIKPPEKEDITENKRQELTEDEEMILKRIEVDAKKLHASFEDIGGLDKVVKELRKVVKGIKKPEVYKKWGTRPPKGILLYGPPGNGKTLLVKALAKESGVRLFHIQPPDFLSMWYGESEKNLATIFKLARSINEKVIIFFDEIEAIFPKRAGSHEATKRLISIMLNELDGIQTNNGSEGNNIIIVAATNMPDGIDPALRRSGRFDKEIEVSLPNEEGRRRIFEIHMKEAEAIAERELFNIDNLDEILSQTKGFSGADIAEIIRRVLEEKVDQETDESEPEKVTKEEILLAIEEFKQEQGEEKKRPMGFVPDS